MSVKPTFEIQNLMRWLGTMPRSPHQIHDVNEADCELVRLPNGGYLASTIDCVAEEISLGLYRDPYTMGWVTAVASLSDLAAVSASPIGALFSTTWKSTDPDGLKSEIARGFREALVANEVALLGGDTSHSAARCLSSVGLGFCETRPTTRLGIAPGDWICITGKTGRGPAMAYRLLNGESDEAFAESNYRPSARLREGVALRGIASAMMDTSDGILVTLDTLRTLNDVGLSLKWDESLLDPKAIEYCRARSIPLWMLWVGQHGDFELMVSVPEERLREALERVPSLSPLGRATASPTCEIDLGDGKPRPIDFSTNEAAHALADVAAFQALFSQTVQTAQRRGMP